MTSRFEDFVDTLTPLKDAEAVWQHTAEYSYKLGFSNCSLTLAKKTSEGLEPAYLISDLPEEFGKIYKNEALISDDPFLQFSCQSLTAKKVASKDLSVFPKTTEKHKIFLDIAAQSGAMNGLGIPVRTSDIDLFGGWVFSSTEDGELFDLLHKEHGQEAQLAAVMAYERMVAIELGGASKLSLLSLREKECLLWLCAGLRSSMIANKLSISESAVNLYITNAKHKLRAKTREQAIARAILSGEITM